MVIREPFSVGQTSFAARQHIFRRFVDDHRVAIIDGGLATELEHQGFNLHDSLWSARLLMDNGQALQRVHAQYLRAGADCIITSAYQATLQGFVEQGASVAEAKQYLVRSTTVAVEARDQWVAGLPAGHPRPVVAGSIGPYGAYLADGSEFHGQYGLTVGELRQFHQERWEIISGSGVDLLACETVPNIQEVEALISLFNDGVEVPGWLSVVCRDDAHLSDGTPIEAVGKLALSADIHLEALGVNCVSPQWVTPLLRRLRASGWDRGLVVYPNSGEIFDTQRRCWTGDVARCDLAAMAEAWIQLGAIGVGGCCRTSPSAISDLRVAVTANNSQHTSPPPTGLCSV